MSHHHQSVIDRLKRLIAFRTLSNDHQAGRTALEWVLQEVAPLDLEATWFEHQQFPSLILTTRKTNRPRLWLQGHMDVVSGSDGVFTATERDGKLFGRGSFDMKYAIAAYIELLFELKLKLKHIDLGIMLTTDEELGGENGVKAILDDGYSSEAVLLPDGGKNWEYVSGSRAIWHVRVESKGETNHGSRPWLGHNAIMPLAAFLTKISALMPTEPCGQPDHFHTSLNVGKISGGTAVNQVPEHATADLDIRIKPGEEQSVKAAVTKLANEYALNLSTLAEGSAYQVDRGNPYFQAYDRILRQHQLEPGSAITYGSSDARHFAAHGIPAIVLRPAGGGHHSEAEWIEVKGLFQFYDTLVEFVEHTCSTNA